MLCPGQLAKDHILRGILWFTGAVQGSKYKRFS